MCAQVAPFKVLNVGATLCVTTQFQSLNRHSLLLLQLLARYMQATITRTVHTHPTGATQAWGQARG